MRTRPPSPTSGVFCLGLHVEPLSPGDSLHLGPPMAIPGECAAEDDPSIQRSLQSPWSVLAGKIQGEAHRDTRIPTSADTYIHLNPVVAGIVEKPEEFVWSGHREIVRKTRDPLLDPDQLLLAFGEIRRAARRSYIESIKASVLLGFRPSGGTTLVAVGSAACGRQRRRTENRQLNSDCR